MAIDPDQCSSDTHDIKKTLLTIFDILQHQPLDEKHFVVQQAVGILCLILGMHTNYQCR